MLMLCPICAEEFQKPGADCPNCGCNLVPETMTTDAQVTTRTRPAGEVKFVELCRPRFYPLAMLIKQTLEQHGIIIWVHGANVVSLMPHLALGGELRVLVDGNQAEYARELYKAYFENDEDVDYILESEAE